MALTLVLRVRRTPWNPKPAVSRVAAKPTSPEEAQACWLDALQYRAWPSKEEA